MAACSMRSFINDGPESFGAELKSSDLCIQSSVQRSKGGPGDEARAGRNTEQRGGRIRISIALNGDAFQMTTRWPFRGVTP